MSDLAQVALDFCRECLGWADVPAYDITDGVAFKFNDLNAVMAAARSWMPGKSGSVSLHCFDGELFVAVVLSDRESGVRSEPLVDPCHALMAACVEAARKLRATA